MTTLLEKFNKEQLKKLPELRPGDTIKVHQKIKEGDKERIQIFEGVIIAKKHGKGISATITVRKVVDGVGVERVFPIHSAAVEKFEVIKHGKARRAKLYYLRTAKGKKSRLKNKEFADIIVDEPAEGGDKGTIEEKVAEASEEAPAGDNPKEETSEK